MQVSRRCSIVLPTPRCWPRTCCSPLRSDHAENSGARHWRGGVSRHGGVCQFAPAYLSRGIQSDPREVIHSDLLLHVVDASDPLWRERMEQVQQVLDEIGAAELRQIVVLNKADLLQSGQQSCRGRLLNFSAIPAGFGCPSRANW